MRSAGIPIPPPPVPPAGDSDKPGEAKAPVLVPIAHPGEGRGIFRFAKEAGMVAAANGLYRRDRDVVTVNVSTGLMEAMQPERFATWLDRRAYVHIRKQNDDGELVMKEKTISKAVASMALQTDDFLEQLPPLVRIKKVRVPVLRKDGRVELLKPGYDVESGILTQDNDVTIDESWDVEKSVNFLNYLLANYPFLDARSKSVHIAGMLTAYAVSMLRDSLSMNFVYNANAPGSGKGMLAKMCIVPVDGSCEVQTIGEDKKEFKKVLDSYCQGSLENMFLDEVSGALVNAELNAFMTAGTWTFRGMGGQKMITGKKTTKCYLAGNNLTLSPDIARRTLTCKLWVETANIRDREFPFDLTEEFLMLKETRADILSALWALIRDWDKNGRKPAAGKIPTFEVWSKLFGGMVTNAGFANPLDLPAAEDTGSNEEADMLELVTQLSAELGPTKKQEEYKFDQLIGASLEHNCFNWMITGAWKKDGNEEYFKIDSKGSSRMGKIFADRFGGQIFTVQHDVAGHKVTRRVRFGNRGVNRHRRYIVALVE